MRAPIDQVPVRALPAELAQALRAAYAQFGTQARVAEQLGISVAAVNQALKNKYRGDIQALEQRIRGAFMKVTVTCPVLGDISTKVCLDEQRRPLSFTNPLRVRISRACKTCPNRRDVQGASKC